MQPIRPGRSPRILAGVLLSTWLVAACSSGAAGSTASAGDSTSPPPTSLSSATPAPSAEASTGLDMPTGDVPALPPRRVVTPKPGQLDVHPIAAESFAATVEQRKVVVEITYASGVAPCYVLDSIVVQRTDHDVAITLRQGHEPGDGVCIEIAEIVRSFVDLGELEPGTYTISDTQKGAAPILVTVP